MDKQKMLAFRIGEEIAEMHQETAEYWLIYVDKAALSIVSQQECYRGASGQVLVISLTDKEMRFFPEVGFVGFVLQVNDAASAELVRRYLLLMNAKETNVHVFSAGKQERSIRAVFQNIVTEIHGELDPNETILNLLLQELLVRLYRTGPKVHFGAYPNRTEIVTSIRALLEKEYRHSFTLEEIAGKYNMSVSYLSHIFKEITGISLMRYLLSVRIRAAQEYLTHTALPINEIAERCGFNDMSNFGRTFRKETGFSPRQYRQAHLKE